MKLTPAERLSLANQFRIRAKLEPNDAEDHNYSADILERGYELFYPEIFQHIYEPISAEDGNEVGDILTLYRLLQAAYSKGIPKPTEGYATFQGFDANNDDQYGFAAFWIKRPGSWDELKSAPPNSHSRGSLPIYRRMLVAWKALGSPANITKEQVDTIMKSVPFSGTGSS
jgi:uncharacterized protein YfbU (UPF0304 family)